MPEFKTAVKPGSTPRNAGPSSSSAARENEYHSPKKRTEYDSGWPSDREEDLDDHGNRSDPFDAGNLSVEYITMNLLRSLPI